jgi:hypothetical protein
MGTLTALMAMLGCLLVLTGALGMVGWTAWNLYPKQENLRPPSTDLCDLDCIEYLESYTYGEPPYGDKVRLVGPVFRKGRISHNKGGYSVIGTPWSEHAQITTAEAYVRIIGCPDLQDGIEAMQIVKDWEAGTLTSTKGLA